MAEREHRFRAEPKSIELPGKGLRIHALDWGPAPGPTVVFLHGGGLNAHTWDVVCDLLREDVRCVAIDLRGHGDSDWDREGDYSLLTHTADLQSAIATLAPDRLVLVGMSLGGLVGLSYAARHDVPPLALVMVDTGPDGSRPAGRRRLHAFMSGTDEFATVEEVIGRAMAFNPRRNRDRLRRTLLNNLRQTDRGTWTWKYDPRIRFLSTSTLSEEEIARRWEERRRFLGKRSVSSRVRRSSFAAARATCSSTRMRSGPRPGSTTADGSRSKARVIPCRAIGHTSSPRRSRSSWRRSRHGRRVMVEAEADADRDCRVQPDPTGLARRRRASA